MVFPPELVMVPVPSQDHFFSPVFLPVTSQFRSTVLPPPVVRVAVPTRVLDPSSFRVISPERFVVHVLPVSVEPFVVLDQVRPVSVFCAEPLVPAVKLSPFRFVPVVELVQSMPSSVFVPVPVVVLEPVRPFESETVRSVVQFSVPSSPLLTFFSDSMVIVLPLSSVMVLVLLTVLEPSSFRVTSRSPSIVTFRVLESPSCPTSSPKADTPRASTMQDAPAINILLQLT